LTCTTVSSKQASEFEIACSRQRPNQMLLQTHTGVSKQVNLSCKACDPNYGSHPVKLFFATPVNTAPHLTLTHDFSSIRLGGPGGSIDPTESLAERQRRSPHD
jgi:hypothetical protein